MSRFIEGQDRQQVTLLPECLDDFIAEDSTVRIVDAFINELDLAALEFQGLQLASTERPSYHPSVLLKLYLYGYLNRIQSSRRLERECQRNVELMWLTGRLAPDFKTIADFRRDNGKGIRNVCRRFVMLCCELKLFTDAVVAIDGNLIVAHEVTNNGSDRAQLSPMALAACDAMGKRRLKAIADRGYYSGAGLKACQDAGVTALVPKPMTSNARFEGRFDKTDFIYIARDDQYQCPAGQRAICRFSREEDGLQISMYWSSACTACSMKAQCTTSGYRRIRRWEHEEVMDKTQQRLDRMPNAMTVRESSIEHVFGTLKHWMGWTHFLTRGFENVATEMNLNVLAYNFRRVLSILGFKGAMNAMRLLGA